MHEVTDKFHVEKNGDDRYEIDKYEIVNFCLLLDVFDFVVYTIPLIVFVSLSYMSSVTARLLFCKEILNPLMLQRLNNKGLTHTLSAKEVLL